MNEIKDMQSEFRRITANIVKDPHGVGLPTKDGGELILDSMFLHELSIACPRVRINDELGKARVWLMSQPRSKRKTRRGMPRFFSSWCNRVEEKLAKQGAGFVTTPTTPSDDLIY